MYKLCELLKDPYFPSRERQGVQKLGGRPSDIGFVVPTRDEVYIHDGSLNYEEL